MINSTPNTHTHRHRSGLPPVWCVCFFYLFSSIAFSADKIDLNFQNIPLSEALTVYADYTKKNLLIDSSIDDIIDLRLNQVTPDQFLNTVLDMYDLVAFSNNGILSILRRSEYETRHQSQLHKVIPIKNISALDLTETLQQKKLSGSKQNNSDLITFNKATNSIVLQGTKPFIDRFASIIESLDVKQKQLLIQAKLVGISDTELQNLGVKLKTAAESGDSLASALVDLGVAGSSSFGYVLSKAGKFLLDVEIQALKDTGTINVVSQPSLFTANNKAASISQGVQIPYQVQDENGAFHNEFKDAVLSLSVLPRISDSDIYLDVAITKDSPADITSDEILIDTRSIRSSLRLNNGETIVLGGIIDSEKSAMVSKVPFLSDIPYLGSWLFTSYSDSELNRNLVVFLTPNIL